jgi:capsid protein
MRIEATERVSAAVAAAAAAAVAAAQDNATMHMEKNSPCTRRTFARPLTMHDLRDGCLIYQLE